jgi:decaprenyl-phosphate phosphoribosyltransferase
MADLSYQKTEQTKDSLVVAVFKAMRPVHWIKNLSIFAAIFLTGFLFDSAVFTKVCWGFVAFCLITSATYIINDLFDAKSDRIHPKKRFRPIASGALPIPYAIIEIFVLVLASIIAVSLGNLDSFFLTILITYLVLQFFYSLFLKNVAILDIIIIATGFVLRVYAGAFIVNAHLSVWFLLCVISVALFLASGKRRSELNLAENTEFLTRKSLKNYKKYILN